MWDVGSVRSVSQLGDHKGKDEDMICVWQVFRYIQNFTYIADTFILEFGEIATICGSGISTAGV